MKKLLSIALCALLLCACGGSKTQPKEESKTLPAETAVLKGKHAKLFKVAGDTYAVNLVKTDDDWQVRVKLNIINQTPFEQMKGHQNYERELQGVCGELLNANDVELESLDMDDSDWDDLLQEDEPTQTSVSGRTWSYKHLGYEAAKDLFDKTTGVEISGLELVQAKKSGSSKLMDDETKEAFDDVKELLEMEKGLLDALF